MISCQTRQGDATHPVGPADGWWARLTMSLAGWRQ